ncbi:oxygen-insensitive NADPH nitroreductase [Paenibacillus crassostreae]|uniref:NADPH-dependent oxidoreductase n=1 Tax=Paenibacillus crassostreae TaxID=1763538 RepID=A0A167BUC9_9BACL|nr:oxygen-insensitive NADPH nitroreductase [Paenibacillus crassostreae]AOZ92505.1 NADPH-dependent oxidoreductase [Paenibacillus crassostreae]OAB72454.1 NADPH-dependent oxidoreductase [Paenibacillus crassostreae]
MNDVISLLMKHRSIRRFTDQPVTEQQLNLIVASAQMASTSSNVQAYSVIAVTEPELKKELASLSGNQAYIEQCPVFLVWCADLYRLQQVTAPHLGEQLSYEDSTENFIVATIDVALAAQNAVVAAESLGLGIVYIGGVRNQVAELSELLGLPELVYPVFGMCVGYPDQETDLRPRLPVDAVLHRNRYSKDRIIEPVNDYDETTKRYMLKRTDGKSDTSWSQVMATRLAQPNRLHMKQFLDSKGFMKQ